MMRHLRKSLAVIVTLIFLAESCFSLTALASHNQSTLQVSRSSTEKKLLVKIKDAEKKRRELAKISVNNSGRATRAIRRLRIEIRKIDNEIERLKVKIELKKRAGLTQEELDNVIDEFLALLEDVRRTLDRLRAGTKRNVVKLRALELRNEIEAEIEVEKRQEVEIRARIEQVDNAFRITVEGEPVTLVGPIDLSPFAGRRVRLEGVFEGNNLQVREIRIGTIRVEAEDGEIRIKLTGKFEKTAEGFEITEDNITFIITGPLVDELNQIAGRQARIRGLLNGDQINLQRLRTLEKVRIEIRVEDGRVRIKKRRRVRIEDINERQRQRFEEELEIEIEEEEERGERDRRDRDGRNGRDGGGGDYGGEG